jgi:deoxycytidylate deaminase
MGRGVKRGIDLALRQAINSTGKKFRVGAVLVQKGRAISVGFNQLKSHPASKSRDNLIHAEFNCLHGLDKDITRGAKVFVALLRKSGRQGLAKPCKDCIALLKEYEVGEVYFTTATGVEHLVLS